MTYTMTITYGDKLWKNVFQVFEGEELTDVIEEVQQDWSDTFGNDIKDFDPELYNMFVD